MDLPSPEILEKRVETLDLSVRTANCLQNAGIETIGQLVTKTEADLLRTKNFGRKSLTEIKEILVELGLHLCDESYRHPLVASEQKSTD